MKIKIAIIYHKADFDGIFSGEICKHYAQKFWEASVDSYGWDYGLPVPREDWLKYDRIFIVDLSVDELMNREDLRGRIVWIDHHKSAIEKFANVDFFDRLSVDGIAACRLCWAYFNKCNLDGGLTQDRMHHEPGLVFLAGIYDVWMKDHPSFEFAKDLQFGLRSMRPELVLEFVQRSLDGDTTTTVREVAENGQVIRACLQRQNDEYSAEYSQTIKWEGLTFCALNIGQRGNSDLLLGGIRPEHDACFAWRWTGAAVMVSLYHIVGKEQHDLSEIAKRHGGGGHKGACGFRLTLEQLDNIIGPQRH